jgi:hypothetical protein
MSITEHDAGLDYEYTALAERMQTAANMSHGAYDSPNDRLARLKTAEHLAVTLKPGEPVLHRRGSLEVVGGHLVESPDIAIVAPSELGLLYRLQTNGDVVDGTMNFRDLAPGFRPGWEPQHYENLPVIVAGTDDIKEFMWRQYIGLRQLEQLPGGVPWQSMAPLTELKALAALAHTDIRMRDVLPSAETLALQIRLYDDYQSHPYLQPLILDAYAGV